MLSIFYYKSIELLNLRIALSPAIGENTHFLFILHDRNIYTVH